MKKRSKRITLLSLAILLIASVAVLMTVLLGSADEPQAEIKHFGYQTVSGDGLGSASTDLRFLFTVGSLSYTRVGFVLSKTNATPTVGGSGCIVYETASVHSAVYANGEKITAPDGRYWVAVKVSGIPNASFSTPIYARPFVQDGSGIRYLSAKDISVCAAFGHDNLVLGKILEAPTLVDPGRQEFTCDRCGDFVAAVDVDAYKDNIADWQTRAAAFSTSDFSEESITENLGRGTSYTYLASHPTKGEHPRVMFNASDLPGMRLALENATSVLKENYYDATFSGPSSGILNPAEDRDDGYHNFTASVMNEIQQMALDYQLTGNITQLNIMRMKTAVFVKPCCK